MPFRRAGRIVGMSRVAVDGVLWQNQFNQTKRMGLHDERLLNTPHNDGRYADPAAGCDQVSNH